VTTPRCGLPVADCERVRDHPPRQPVNAASSAAYLVAAVDVLRRSRRQPAPGRGAGREFAATLAGLGAGSLAYHGSGTALARWTHDVALIATLGFVARHDLASPGWPGGARRGWLPALGVTAAGLALAPGAAQRPTGLLAAACTVAQLRAAALGRPVPWAGVGAVLTGIVLHALGRTGGPLCRPERRLQPHAAWHVLSAVALLAWSRRRLEEGTGVRRAARRTS
jgi:hypothetical protein